MASLYRLTSSANNKIFRFGVLFGAASLIKKDSPWRKKLDTYVKIFGGISAVSLNKNIFEKMDVLRLHEKDTKSTLTAEGFAEYQAYLKTKEHVMKAKQKTLSLDFLIEVHSLIMQGDDEGKKLRTIKRLLPKEVSGLGVVRHIEFEVKTLPEEISKKLDELIVWFNENIQGENALIMAAIVHFKIAEIHPFADGNGRLSRILEYFVFKCGNMDISELIAPEHYYLTNSDRYYDLLESCIATGNLTPWIEFYTENVLSSITNSAKLLYQFSGGAIDIVNSEVTELSELEEKVISLLISSEDDAGPTEIAKKLNYSRQNIYRTLRSLNTKGLLSKITQITGVRYKIK